VRHRDQVVTYMGGSSSGKGRAKVKRELVAEEVEIHPRISAAPFGATQYATIKLAGDIEVGNVKGKVKKTAHGAQDISLAV